MSLIARALNDNPDSLSSWDHEFLTGPPETHTDVKHEDDREMSQPQTNGYPDDIIIHTEA